MKFSLPKLNLNSLYIESHDWKKRTEALKRVQEISLLFDDVVEGTIGINGQLYLNQMSRLYQPLTAQVKESIMLIFAIGPRSEIRLSEGSWKNNLYYGSMYAK